MLQRINWAGALLAGGIVLICLGGLLSTANAQKDGPAARPQVPRPQYKEGELLVKFKPGVTRSRAVAILDKVKAKKTKKFSAPRNTKRHAIGRWWHVTLDKAAKADKVLEALREDAAIERIEFNYEVSINALPNDPDFSLLWGLENTGQTGGVSDADIDATEAWDLVTGSDAVVVAVIDSGVDYTHPDLAANIWINAGEVPDNGIDDDGNGLVDDVRGYDFSAGDNDPMDEHSHGTHVAGTIAAVGNNATGIVGVNWTARIMPVRFLGPTGSGSISDAIEAVLYATQMGARVMNNSWGGGGYSEALFDAISAANEAGAVFVASAGNDNWNNDVYPAYPTSYEVPNVISVAALDASDGKASFSNWGVTSVDLAAPGVAIYSTLPGGVYGNKSGTSMAAPHVSGVAALLLAQDPDRTVSDIKRHLLAGVDPVPSMAGKVASEGRLNAYGALTCHGSQLVMHLLNPGDPFKAFLGEPAKVMAELYTCNGAISDAAVVANFDNGDAAVALFDDGQHDDGIAGDGIYAGVWVPGTKGTARLTVSATHPTLGSATRSVAGEIKVLTSYRYESASYQWIDATRGTGYTFGDWTVVNIPIGFSFNFYGVDRDSISISRNGYATFHDPDIYAIFSVREIPDTFPPDDLIAAYGIRAEVSPTVPIVYTLLEGTAPNRRLTIAWVNAKRNFEETYYTFEMTLYEGSNDIVFQYQDTGYAFPVALPIGMEDADAWEFTTYRENGGVVTNGTALRFYQTPFNHNPVADPGGPYEGFAKSPLTFDGSKSYDQDGDALAYHWDFGDWSTGVGAAPSHSYFSKGTYTVTLVVSDGYKDSEPISTTVNLPNHPPVADPGGPYEGLGQTLIQFDGSGSYDPDSDPLSFTWMVYDGDGQVVPQSPVYGPGGFFYPGVYTVTLTVNDGEVDSALASTTMTVINQPPAANAGWDTTVSRGKTAHLLGGGSDVDGTVVAYQWTQVAGPAVALQNADTTNPSFYIAKNFKPLPAELIFELKVTDNLGATDTDQVAVTVVRW